MTTLVNILKNLFRYKKENMMQLAIISGPEHPKNIASFLEPIVEDLNALGTTGLWFQTGGGYVVAKVHLVMATGDTPAVSDLMNLTHHNSQYGCQHCFAQANSEFRTMCIVEREGPATLRDVESIRYSVGNIGSNSTKV
ncbi:hypothetical protein PHYBLDRAFT_111204 [Phycomyces blakesleeanus NRRL 1555(-)]|uniref:Uncharacterized protein n=1 Tax=Phycomyces blakesleeanus (strain ATCC 8743b / DSM 1359 / FGSC 10004 / NBRC 33097 / NRRL 1555) TaxID=763407 RepID=A0A162PPZ9_PHYB8|nr:hypothetical protein PHYBLDRAFT_111204 [Phycomyces blakesleeanus NRRL 1555(-)]OAD74897.1 hypothetical protein PHYBLDRAFT_111204 [Phycomyces blakesleeanus NRRL 1555(-)]|eukprot:XP_018292937.1 hypothetical protein PHYBLDRAFT_111204 [Phycomyces blakesleeanus NRRL 1555(-)]